MLNVEHCGYDTSEYNYASMIQHFNKEWANLNLPTEQTGEVGVDSPCKWHERPGQGMK